MRNLAAALAVVGFVSVGAGPELGLSSAHAGPALTDTTMADVTERVVPSVVNIATHSSVRGPAAWDPAFTDPTSPLSGRPSLRRQMSKGSGVIVSADGRILTNAHVVKGASEITITLHDGSERTAKIIGADPKADLAVLQLEGKLPPLSPIPFGDSDALRLGEVVLAVGDPFGIGKSVTMGIVSAKGRGGMGIEEYEDFIQTDAAINPGNSGGALVNLRGELVGINTAIASPSGGYAGIGFAIPTNMAHPIMEMLVKDGKVSRGYLGVNIATVTARLAKEHKLPATRGALVADVQPDSPAARAGLADGDVIVALNGAPVRSGDALRNTIAMTRPGTIVNLEIMRANGNKAVLDATLGELPSDDAQGRPRVIQRSWRR